MNQQKGSTLAIVLTAVAIVGLTFLVVASLTDNFYRRSSDVTGRLSLNSLQYILQGYLSSQKLCTSSLVKGAILNDADTAIRVEFNINLGDAGNLSTNQWLPFHNLNVNYFEIRNLDSARINTKTNLKERTGLFYLKTSSPKEGAIELKERLVGPLTLVLGATNNIDACTMGNL